jgi:hypothetical protein
MPSEIAVQYKVALDAHMKLLMLDIVKNDSWSWFVEYDTKKKFYTLHNPKPGERMNMDAFMIIYHMNERLLDEYGAYTLTRSIVHEPYLYSLVLNLKPELRITAEPLVVYDKEAGIDKTDTLLSSKDTPMICTKCGTTTQVCHWNIKDGWLCLAHMHYKPDCPNPEECNKC